MSNKDRLFAGLTEEYAYFGNLRLRKYGDVLNGEAEILEDDDRRSGQELYRLETVKQAIATAEGITEEEVTKRIFTTETQDKSLVLKYGSQIAALVAQQTNTVTAAIALATLFIQSRGEVLMEDGSWEPIEGWTEADTRRWPKGQRAQLDAFIAEERAAAGGKPKPNPAPSARRVRARHGSA
jgi:hypothetical protein